MPRTSYTLRDGVRSRFPFLSFLLSWRPNLPGSGGPHGTPDSPGSRRSPGSALSTGIVLVAASISAWACGSEGGGGTTGPNTDPKPVASVTVSPETVELEVGQTRQLSATLRDASGNVLTGRSVAWSSSNQAVASVSSTGMVTGADAGAATITATSEGRTSQASVTVTEALAPGVVATGDIGPGGGTVETTEVGVTIPAGQLQASTKIEILSYDDPIPDFGSDMVTEGFRLRGMPQDRDVEVRVRLRTTGALREQSYIGMGVPTLAASNAEAGPVPGFVLREAADSAGFLVATFDVRGQAPQPSPEGAEPAAAGGVDALMDGLFGGVTGVKADTVPGGRWVILSWGAPRAQLLPLVGRAAKLVDDAWTTMDDMGYTMAHRTKWPMEIRVKPLEYYGLFGQKLPFPLDPNTGYFEFGIWAFAEPDMPGTAIHEFFHFVQAGYTKSMLWPQASGYRWMNEAASTWVETLAPETIGVFRNSFFQGHRRNLFVGLYPSLTADHGYGKAPLMKYVADRWGAAQIRWMYNLVAGGTPSIDAVLQSIPEAPAVWWPDLLTKYMKGEIISLAADSLPPNIGETPMAPGTQTWSWNNDLRPLAAQFGHFTPKPGDYGTGTTFTVRVPAALRQAGFRILPFRMDASGEWEELGGVADSLVVEGPDLNLGRRYGFFIIHTTPTAPYTQTWANKYETDLGYVEGDWFMADVEVTNDAIVYQRPSESDTTTIDVTTNVPQTFGMLSSGGIWKRKEDKPNQYVWSATPDFAAQLAGFNATASSEAIIFATGDSLFVRAEIDVAPPASTVGESGTSAALGAAGFLLLLGLAMRRRREVLTVSLAAAFGLALWGCDLASINFSSKFRYEFRFGNPSLTASAEDATAPLVQLENGTGVVFVDRYVSEFWEYIRDAEDVIVDSVAVTRTASGKATVQLDATLYNDGAIDPDDVGAILKSVGLPEMSTADLQGLLEINKKH